MKPKALPVLLTVLMASSAAHSQSSVTIAGALDTFAGRRQLSGGPQLTRVESGGMTTSQLVFNGVEDLGGGTRAEFLLGMFLRTDSGSPGRFDGDAFWGRGSYVGLANEYGTVRLGRQSTQTFVNFIRTNSFGDSATFGPAFVQTWISAIGQGSQFLTPGAPPTSRTRTAALGTTDTAWNNSITYASPNLGGLVMGAQWASGNAAGVGNRFGASAFYASGPLNLSFALESIGNASVPASGPAAAVIAKQETYLLSAAYAFPWTRVSAGYFETRRDYATIVDDKVKTAYVGATIPIGPNAIMWQTAWSKQAPDSGASVRRTTTSLGYDHFMSKRTDLYAVYMRDHLTNNGNGNSVAVGIRHRF